MVDPLTGSSLELPPGIWLPARLSAQMQAHVHSQAPLEACGLVGGSPTKSGEQIHALGVFEVTNALLSPVRYRMDPQEQVRIFIELERRGWDLLAIYHSHPKGSGIPSATDLAEAAYPEAIHLIWSPQQGETHTHTTWRCRAFLLHENTFFEIPIWGIEE